MTNPQRSSQPSGRTTKENFGRGTTRRRLRRKKNVDGTMSIAEHIKELRKRLVVGLIAILAGTVVGYMWYSTHIGVIPSLGELLREPYCSLPPEARFGSENGECRLLATSPFEMFMLRLKVGFLAGLVISSPVWIGQIWRYITPGLKKNEKRWALSVSFLASLFFILGAVLAYLVLEHGLHFLLTVGDEAQIAALTGQDYFNFALILLVVFGISFEVPLLTVMMSFAGLITYKQISSKRRYIIVGLFAFAAVVTPADPFSMLALGIALTLMMEIGYQIIRLNDRRREKRAAAAGDDDISAPAADVTSSGNIDTAAPVERASSIGGAGPTSGAGHDMGRRNSFNYAEIFNDRQPGGENSGTNR